MFQLNSKHLRNLHTNLAVAQPHVDLESFRTSAEDREFDRKVRLTTYIALGLMILTGGIGGTYWISTLPY